jgi:hypothetical protein
MEYPCIRNLPEVEQGVFAHWLFTQTRPLLRDVPDSEQDAYYQHDYDLWKSQGTPLEQRWATCD